MLKRLVLPIVAALLALAVLPVAAAAATSPWWQVNTGARPTNLWLPKSELQELRRASSGVTTVALGGKNVACMGSATCPLLFGLPDVGTAAQLQASLEAAAAYGAGNVEVSESPAASGRFLIAAVGGAAGRYLPPLTVTGQSAAATVLTQGGSGSLVLTVTNLGDAPVDGTVTPVTISDMLPQGLAAYHATARAGAVSGGEAVPCQVVTTGSVTCTFAATLPSYEAIEIEIDASLTASPPLASEPGLVTVSGGNAPAASAAQAVSVSEAATPFGLESYSLQAEEEGGALATQAGSHPFQLTTTIQFTQGALIPGTRGHAVEVQPGLPRNLRFRLPAGLVGNATAVPRCSSKDFTTVKEFGDECPAESAVGVASVTVIEATNFGLIRLAVPVFNLVPAPGEPARFGLMVVGVPVVLDTAVRGGEDYGVTVSVNNTSQTAQLLASTVTLWGVPGDPRHDASRGWNCAYHLKSRGACSRSEGLEARPFLRLPTSCGAPLSFPMELEPWNTPPGADVTAASSASGPLDGCNREPFEPRIDVESDTQAAATPSGLTVHLKIPQEASEAPAGVAAADVRNTRVTLPAGLKINPAAANGLRACSEAQVGFSRMAGEEAVFDEAPAACPEASRLGSVKIHSPLLEEELSGSVYQAAQGANPFGSLLALYVVAEAPGAGIRVKLAGEVEPTPSGQLIASFNATPQLPFEEFALSFFGGAGAPLATSGCGAYRTETRIDPWSGAAAATPSSEFQVTSGPGGGACQSPEPFQPSFTAGTETPIAGSYSPFVLRLGRADGSQQLSSIDAVLPPGVSGKLAGIPYCPEAAIQQAEARGGPGEGAVEQAAPSCPAASQVGSVRVGAGVGPSPYFVTGEVYLAGPYKTAPLSLAIVTPALAGPFDLGTVVVRAALYVNPETAQITARSDPLPTLLQGIPLDLRSIALKMDRPDFTLNPTSCERMSVTGTATSVSGQGAGLANPFQVGACNALGFSPKLSLRLKGATRRNGNPALTATVSYAGNRQANIKRVSVALPHSEFLDQSHIRTVCTRVQFAASQCPAGSIYGYATATTPLLDQPLRGPVYLRSSSNPLPDLVVALHGQIDVDLDGRIDSVRGGIRNSFETVPDAPVTRFTLRMKGGKRGLLVNSRDLCGSTSKATVKMVGQNGKVDDFRSPVRNGCRKHRPPRPRR